MYACQLYKHAAFMEATRYTYVSEYTKLALCLAML